MKTFKLTMMAAMLAFAGTAMAQELTPITAGDITIANGETADLVVKLNYELEAGAAEICGANLAVYLPDGIVFDGFDDQESFAKAKASKLKQAVAIDEDGVWGDDVDDGFVNKAQMKTDGGVLIVLIDQDDKTPFQKTTDVTLCTITLKAIADVKDATATIGQQALTNVENKSVGMVDGASIFGDSTFQINGSTDGINEIQNAGDMAPAYNLQGVRVNNAKGLIIRDGKKMIVK